MKPIGALAAVPVLLCLAQVTSSQDEAARSFWIWIAKHSYAVVTVTVIEPNARVERPDLRTERITRFPDGSFRVESAPERTYQLGHLVSLRVDGVYKPDGRVAPGGVIRLFVDWWTILELGKAYILFLRPDITRDWPDPDPFRGTTLVVDAGEASQEVPFDPGGVYGLTLVSESFPASVRAIVRRHEKTAAEIQQIETNVQESLDDIPPTLSFVRAPRPVIRGIEPLQVHAQDKVGVGDVEFFAQRMEPGGSESTLGFATRPPYSTSWDTTGWPEGRYRVWALARDLAENESRTPPVDVIVDRTPPALTIRASPSVIWPPDGTSVPVVMTVEVWDAVKAWNRIDGLPQVRLFSIIANDPDPLAGVAEASFGEDDRAFTLEAVPGREYQITYEAEDAAGNTRQSRVRVKVRNPVVRTSTPN